MYEDRASVPEGERWSVELIFPDMDAWQREFEAIENALPGMEGYKGTLHEGGHRIAEFLEASGGLERRADLVYTYAHLRHDEDTRVEAYHAAHNKARDLMAALSAITAFFCPELLALPPDKAEAFLAGEELAPYHTHLRRILDLRPHVLSAAEERLLAELSPCLQAAGTIFRAFNDADLRFESLQGKDEEEIPLTHGSWYGLMIHPHRELRARAFDGFFGTFSKWGNLLASTLDAQAKKHATEARLRGYSSTLEAALTPRRLKREVHDNLLNTMKAGMGTHHRYLRLRKKLLGVDRLEFYDLYAPLAKIAPKKYTKEEAVEVVLAAVSPLGKEYRGDLSRGFEERWVDWPECRGKRSGAYSSGCYDSRPYILMNFDGTLNGVFTLAHEAGHSLHSHYSKRGQPFFYSQYPIFLAEVASTLNEQLLAH
ncbi:MAG: oligoendopeptidase F family protein, partial [Planctomycetes bacterium]|nr:oligoendopeptidase F family protein [Planctomycetota bacterium]